MKNKFPIFLFLILIILTFLLSCCNLSPLLSSSDSNSSANTSDEKLDLLESQILLLIQTQNLSKEEYKTQIEKLTKEIEDLKNIAPETKDEPSIESPTQSSPETSLDTATFTYTLSDESNAIITGYTGEDEVLVFPTKIDGYKVTEISDSAISSATVKEIIISENITKIGWFAFSDCSKLKTITIPSSVTKIGYSIFGNNNKSITIKCEKNSFAQSYAESYGISYILV